MHVIPLPIQLYVPLLLAVLGLALVGLIAVDRRLVQSIQRAGIGRQLRCLRLNRMLRPRGISREQYLGSFAIADLRRQLALCRNCTQQQRCDEAFVTDPSSDLYQFFCSNAFTLIRLQVASRGQSHAEVTTEPVTLRQ
jgi:hypothetical protein